MNLSRYVKIYPCAGQPGRSLLYSTKRSAAIIVPDQLIDSVQDGTLAGGNLETLARLGFVVADLENERQEMRDIFIVANRERRLFNAIAVLNLDCNLACSYCYEDNFRGNFYMTEETADLLAETVIREQVEQGDDVNISFYGGEPLLSIPLIKRISERIGAAARKNGTAFRFSLTSNGTLLNRDVVAELAPLGLVGAKITLDGPRETHDASRPFVSGSGSFDAIAANLAGICTMISIHLGGNFTRDNYRVFPRLLDDLTARGIAPQSLGAVQFAPVVQKSGEKGAGDFSTGNCICSFEPWLTEAALYLREETLKRGFPTPKIKMSACSVEYDKDVVVNYDGSLYKCPAFMSNDALKIGTLKEGIGAYRTSHNLDVWKTDQCLDCPYLPICFGGCRYMTLSRAGAIDGVDCRKDYYDAALEALVRQDLAHQTKRKPD